MRSNGDQSKLRVRSWNVGDWGWDRMRGAGEDGGERQVASNIGGWSPRVACYVSWVLTPSMKSINFTRLRAELPRSPLDAGRLPRPLLLLLSTMHRRDLIVGLVISALLYAQPDYLFLALSCTLRSSKMAPATAPNDPKNDLDCPRLDSGLSFGVHADL